MMSNAQRHHRVLSRSVWDTWVGLVDEWAGRGANAAIWYHTGKFSVCVVIGASAARGEQGWRLAYGVVAGKTGDAEKAEGAWLAYEGQRSLYEAGQGRGYVFTRKLPEGAIEVLDTPAPFNPYTAPPRRRGRKVADVAHRTRGPLPGHGGRPKQVVQVIPAPEPTAMVVTPPAPRMVPIVGMTLPPGLGGPLPGDPGNPIDLGSAEETEAERAMREADEMMTGPIPASELPPPKHAGGRPRKAKPPPDSPEPVTPSPRKPPVLTGDPDKDF